MGRPAVSYLSLDLKVERAGDAYRASVQSPAGEESLEGVTFPPEVTQRPGDGSDDQRVGELLYEAVFRDGVEDCLLRSLDKARESGQGLRIRLRLGTAPELIDLPWELLRTAKRNRFFALNSRTPVVRYLEQPEPVTPLSITTPVRVLVMIANPPGTETLDVGAEWDKLRQGTAAAVEGGYVELQKVTEPTLGSLSDHLRAAECHVFHFIGHGGFLEGEEVGALLMQDDEGRPRLVTGEALGSLLWGYERDTEPPRLVVLNACEGAMTGTADPFAGVAEALVQQGMPVVVAMRTEVSDRASISFAEGFYRAFSFGAPVEFALGQARWAIFTDANEHEWATPVLYTRLPEGRPFEVQHLTEEQRLQAERESTVRAFWNPTGAKRVTVVFGKWPKTLTEQGELEDVVTLSFAMILGELRSFLTGVYEEVEMTDDPAAADRATPLVALGGPMSNELTAGLTERYSPPVWFRGLPYESNSQRSIGTDEDAFMPRIDEGGALMSDVGLAARIVEPDGRPVFVIAGCFGAGTLGAARYVCGPENLSHLLAQTGPTGLEAVIRSQVSGWDVSGTELVQVKSW
jgi:hypothetical protein